MPRPYRSPRWEEEEDNALLHLIRRHGLNDFFRVWTEMHAFHPTAYGRTSRTRQECVERYEYLLSPLNSDPVTTEESILIDDWVEKTAIRWPETKRRRGQGSNDAASRNRLYWSPREKPSPLDTPEHQMLLQRMRLRKPGPKKTDRLSSITRRRWRVESIGNGRLYFRSQILGPETKRQNRTLTHGSSISDSKRLRLSESLARLETDNQNRLKPAYDQFTHSDVPSNQMFRNQGRAAISNPKDFVNPSAMSTQWRQRQKAAEDSIPYHPTMTGIAAGLIGSATGLSVLAPMTTVGGLPSAYYSSPFAKHIDQLEKEYDAQADMIDDRDLNDSPKMIAPKDALYEYHQALEEAAMSSVSHEQQPLSRSSFDYRNPGNPRPTISSSQGVPRSGQVLTQNGATEPSPQINISKSQISMKNTAFHPSFSDSSSHTPKLFISNTISQDCTGSEDANRASLLIALKQRPRGLKFRNSLPSNGVTKRRHL